MTRSQLRASERKSQRSGGWSPAAGFSAAIRCCLGVQSEDGFLSERSWLVRQRRAPWIFCLRFVCHWPFHGKEKLQLSAMGNVCGCVRGPREECYVDPKKAPLRPESKAVKGRRYFHSNKRKSKISGPVDPLNNPGCEAVTSEAVGISGEPQNDPEWNVEESQAGQEVGTCLSRQGSLSRGVCVGEVPLLTLRDSYYQPHKTLTPKTSTDDDRGRTTADKNLHEISVTSRVPKAREALLVKKLICRQLSRAVSFGAVEHTLQTLRVSDRSRNEEAFAKIICGSQATRRRRRRASSCSGYIQHYPFSAKSATTDHKVNL